MGWARFECVVWGCVLLGGVSETARGVITLGGAELGLVGGLFGLCGFFLYGNWALTRFKIVQQPVSCVSFKVAAIPKGRICLSYPTSNNFKSGASVLNGLVLSFER